MFKYLVFGLWPKFGPLVVYRSVLELIYLVISQENRFHRKKKEKEKKEKEK